MIIKYSTLWESTYKDVSFHTIFFRYCTYTSAIQLIREVFHLSISFSCWFIKILDTASGECALVHYFHFIINTFYSLHYHKPSHMFPLGQTAVTSYTCETSFTCTRTLSCILALKHSQHFRSTLHLSSSVTWRQKQTAFKMLWLSVFSDTGKGPSTHQWCFTC